MEVSFGQNEQAAPVVDVQATVTTPAVAPTPAPAPASQVPATVRSGPAARTRILGDELPDFKDVIMPRLNIVQNIGKLSEDIGEPGALVYNQNSVLFLPPVIQNGQVKRQPSPPVIITVFGFRPTRFCEKVQGGGRGIIVNSEDEVRANNGTLDWAEWNAKKASGMKRFEPLADALVALRRPADIDPEGAVFNYDVDGEKYALAMWALHGTSYTAACKRTFFAHRFTGCLRQGGYPSWNYSLTTREESYPNGNKSWIPVCSPVKKNTEAFLDFVRSIIG